MNFRSGRRAENHDKKKLKNKIRSRQRSSTHKSVDVHSNAKKTFDNLLKNS